MIKAPLGPEKHWNIIFSDSNKMLHDGPPRNFGRDSGVKYRGKILCALIRPQHDLISAGWRSILLGDVQSWDIAKQISMVLLKNGKKNT